ncbi:MAG: hypothetical protein JAY99_13105 [Candidatus Thiodiazotropha lotti]|uniref:hypothetical protein n=1 Tax=Candidatus Thiodiazotropha endoloripes TaxID=1818881 RepID=UPI00083E6674|nr:hypothetical protein [Candidatus Thiodiazotropha endoloripes]MCG7991812.1 hypothetical protein [Candidatus Thiodiazotropha lotti]MCW4183470.1 hypothetical protein [Candidatus Thiodiazotropha weberae]MCG8000459.1 hypothetical protein [Candidatus Thiodiazotropha lotti]MCW4192229.1 hypothetical protein [Candidatus Thiodiazotropha weberae]ODB84012.1 hypothetical protein A3193_14330 [Candidatus Thiodiazotropha endoloripes]
MNTQFRVVTKFFLFILALIVSINQSYAACTRSDVEYYLGKGFSTDQITKICTSIAPTGSNETPGDKTDMATPTEKKAGEDAQQPRQIRSMESSSAQDIEQFLRIAIKGRDIQLTQDSLNYTREECVQIGEEDLYGFAPIACQDVKFAIGRKGLEVLKTGKKYILYGDGVAIVKGSIHREIIGQLKDRKPRDRKLILAKMEKGDQTAIPIRDDISLERVEKVLRELSN